MGRCLSTPVKMSTSISLIMRSRSLFNIFLQTSRFWIIFNTLPHWTDFGPTHKTSTSYQFVLTIFMTEWTRLKHGLLEISLGGHGLTENCEIIHRSPFKRTHYIKFHKFIIFLSISLTFCYFVDLNAFFL